jgi:hypothetical protein
MKGRIYQHDIDRIRERLAPRDLAVIDQIYTLRLMTGAQIQAVHFPLCDHESDHASARARRRVLQRLVRDGLLVRLERRVGGVKGGSSGYIFGASALGQRIMDGNRHTRFREPSATFVTHTLAITQLVVDVIEAQRARKIELLHLEPEPRCWRAYTTPSGREIVRPDMFVAIAQGEFEHHWFVEIDLGTETINRRLTKCAQYDAYYRSGTEQARHDLFPRVLWAVPNVRIAAELQARIQQSRRLTSDIFAVVTSDELVRTICGDAT